MSNKDALRTLCNEIIAGSTPYNQAYIDALLVGNMSNLFNKNLEGLQWEQLNLGEWNVSKVTNMSNMFNGQTKFTGSGLEHWNTSGVTSMWGMFLGATTFNGKIGSWDVSQVDGMGAMFQNATYFQGTGIGRWNTSAVTKMWGMFYGATAFNEDIGRWDVSKVTTMQNMFRGAADFNQDISNWNVYELTHTLDMFQGSGMDDANIKKLSNWSPDDSLFDGNPQNTGKNVNGTSCDLYVAWLQQKNFRPTTPTLSTVNCCSLLAA